MRVYLDEDALDSGLFAALISHGFDVVTAEQARMRGRSDIDHLLFATTQGRVLYGYNRKDYFRLHTELLADDEHHAGIIVTGKRTYDIGTQLRRIIAVAELRGQDGMLDWLEVI